MLIRLHNERSLGPKQHNEFFITLHLLLLVILMIVFLFAKKQNTSRLHLDYVLSFGLGIHDLVRIDHGFLGTFSFFISSSIGEPDNILSPGFFPYLWP